MSKKFSRDPLRGFKDFYPEDLREFNWIVSNIEHIAELYSYDEFRSPQLEPVEIFAAKTSDELVNEQSFIVEKKEGERLILIPELTPSLARMIANKSQELKKPIRWYSNPTCFRYERPQRGRRRMFNQINFDILGEDTLYAELEIFNIIVDIFREFGATADQFQIFYNSRRFIDILCKNILKISQDKIPMVYKVIDKSDKLEKEEFEKYLNDTFQDNSIIEGVLKLTETRNINEVLKQFDDIPQEFYSSKEFLELENFQKLITASGLSNYCTFSPSIVRGLDYYTGIVFEVFDTGKENIRSIFGGGRYDDLLSIFSDERISGIGFGLGILMLTLFLKTYNLIPEEIYKKDYTNTIFIASVSKEVANYSIKLAHMIRQEDFACIVDYRFSNLTNQLSKANDLGVSITLIVGPDEVEEHKVTLKNLVTEEQISVKFEDVTNEIYRVLDEIEES